MGNSSQVFFVSLVVLLMALMVLMILYLILKDRRKPRNLTVLRVTATQPTRILTITTEPVHGQRILDHLLDRVFLEMERGPQAGESRDPGAEPSEELGSDSESYQDTPPVIMLSGVTTLRDKLSRWTTIMFNPEASSSSSSPAPPPPPPPPPPTNQDQPEDINSQASSEYEGAFCSPDRK